MHYHQITKYAHRNFWPQSIILIPIFMYVVYLCIKARSFFFFSTCNPGIPFGGLIGDAKYPVLKQIPDEYAPKTIFVPRGANVQELSLEMEKQGITYPCIIKPDVGEGGVGVEKLHNEQELSTHIKTYDQDMVLQEYIPGENELTVMYYRYPGHKKGVVDFMASKEFLSVVGDGKRTLGELVRAGKRTKFFVPMFSKEHKEFWNTIIADKEKYLLQYKGNYTQGTAFFDASELITPELHHAFDYITDHIQGLYFGRCDVKYDDINTFSKGKGFKILDVNGVGAAPSHANDAKYSLLQVRKMWIKHRNIIYRISKINHNHGVPYGTFREFFALKKNFTMQMKKYQ